MNTMREFPVHVQVFVRAWRRSDGGIELYSPNMTNRIGDLWCPSVVQQPDAQSAWVVNPQTLHAIRFSDVDSAIVALTFGLEP